MTNSGNKPKPKHQGKRGRAGELAKTPQRAQAARARDSGKKGIGFIRRSRAR